uniref:Uncharacterized protein n=1 Tax=Rhizophora mucronata TaxID=61149 RepID=A0A2P2MZU6_RHIMU
MNAKSQPKGHTLKLELRCSLETQLLESRS